MNTKLYFSNSQSVVLLQDFGDGGAFPEIAVAQYPLGMGQKKSSSNALAVQLDAKGKIKYDAIAKYGHAKDKVSVYFCINLDFDRKVYQLIEMSARNCQIS